jgi:hypothetical protein
LAMAAPARRQGRGDGGFDVEARGSEEARCSRDAPIVDGGNARLRVSFNGGS